MLIRQKVEITIKNKTEEIWNFAADPKNWTASNTLEHKGLKIFNKNNRPETGANFHQKELVAGIFADLKGHFLYVEKPKIVVWTGIAAYKLLGGLITIRIPEGGTATITQKNGSVRLAHDVFMNFPESIVGKIMYWCFINLLNGQKAVFDHANRELVYFKKQLDKN